MDPDEIGLANLVAESQGVEIPEGSTEPETKTEVVEETTETTPKVETPAEVPAAEETPTEKPSEPLKTETESSPEPETKIETPESKVDWTQFLPPAPQVPPPQPDENGDISREDYTKYIIAQAKAELEYDNKVKEFKEITSQQLDEAEKILPDIKSNPKTRALVENHRIATAINGQSGDLVTAAQDIKSLLDEARAEGAKNAQASVTIQKAAAVETGSSPAPSEEEVQGEQLAKRINAGDDEAVVELLSIWDEKGFLS